MKNWKRIQCQCLRTGERTKIVITKAMIKVTLKQEHCARTQDLNQSSGNDDWKICLSFCNETIDDAALTADNRVHSMCMYWARSMCVYWRMFCLYSGSVQSSCVVSSLSDLQDIRQLDSLFILHSLLAELTGPDSPAYTSYCLTAYAIIMQIWQVCTYL